MKKLSQFFGLLSLSLCLMVSAQAQNLKHIDQISLSCEGAVVKGCVGDCGSSFSATHVITPEDVKASIGKDWAVMCLQPSPVWSLCPNTGAMFEISTNGIPISSGDLTEGDKGFAIGRVGDVVRVDVNLVDKNNGIVCFQQGQINFDLGYIQLSY